MHEGFIKTAVHLIDRCAHHQEGSREAWPINQEPQMRAWLAAAGRHSGRLPWDRQTGPLLSAGQQRLAGCCEEGFQDPGSGPDRTKLSISTQQGSGRGEEARPFSRTSPQWVDGFMFLARSLKSRVKKKRRGGEGELGASEHGLCVRATRCTRRHELCRCGNCQNNQFDDRAQPKLHRAMHGHWPTSPGADGRRIGRVQISAEYRTCSLQPLRMLLCRFE